VLHQIELHQREITGDHFPYGLQLLTNALSPMTHGGDPVAFLNLDPVLTQLRVDSQNPAFIPDLIRRWLLNNPHRVRIVMAPDPSLAAHQLAAERAQLDARQAAMTAADQTKVIEQAQALQARQQTKDNPELLPKVGLADVAIDLTIPEGTSRPIATYPATWFARGTNGIVYQKIILELPEFEEELLELFPLFCECVTEIGCGDRSYLETVAWQSAVTGGVNARISLRGDVAEIQAIRGVYSLSGKALIRNQAALSELLRETLERVHFNELPRLRELIAQLRADSDNSITSRGHQLAMTASTSGMNPSGALSHRWHGLAGIQSLKTLDDSLEDNTALAKFASQLERIRDQLLTMPRQFLIVSEATPQDEIATTLNNCWQAAPAYSESPSILRPQPVNTLVKQAWSTSTQVNFCAKAYSTVAATHPDAPVLTVLGDFLRNGYLHTALRERGGAYGGGAHYDSDTSAFRFYTLRDPRLVETLVDFDRSLDWLQNTPHESRELEEAILGVVSRIDRPGSPAGDAIKSFFGSLHGRTPAQRREFRQRVLNVTLADLQRVAMTYLQPTRANVAVLSDAKTLEKVPELELEKLVL
jgi:Zn-dependent M16 (insulinase) family peptidase